MIRGIHNGTSVIVKDYSEDEVESVLETFLTAA